jgi:Cu/Ag efflux pump CusA
LLTEEPGWERSRGLFQPWGSVYLNSIFHKKPAQAALHEVPEVVSTTRRTGRAELDEHAAGVNLSEIEVVTREGKRPHSDMMEEVRQKLARIPGVTGEVGQPISHRIDHLLSGTRAQIAIKLTTCWFASTIQPGNQSRQLRRR